MTTPRLDAAAREYAEEMGVAYTALANELRYGRECPPPNCRCVRCRAADALERLQAERDTFYQECEALRRILAAAQRPHAEWCAVYKYMNDGCNCGVRAAIYAARTP